MPAVTVFSRPKRRADGHDPFADLEPVHVADLHRRQAGGLDLHHGHIGALVRADDAGLELALVGQRDQMTSSAPSTTWALVMT
jgi:hypothetical protein